MKKITFFIILGLIPICMFSFGRREQSINSNEHQIETIESNDSRTDNDMENLKIIVGRVEIFGNVPNTYVGIIEEKGKRYSVYPPSQEEALRDLQGYDIEFNVILLDTPQGYGSLFLRDGTVTPLSWVIIQQ